MEQLKQADFILQVANASDTMTGNAVIVDTDTNDNAEGFMTAATSDTITLNGSTTGGLAGTIITCKAIGANGKMGCSSEHWWNW